MSIEKEYQSSQRNRILTFSQKALTKVRKQTIIIDSPFSDFICARRYCCG